MLASSKIGTDIGSLLHGYQLCALTEGKSTPAIAIVTRSVNYLSQFLAAHGLSTDVTQIGSNEMRAFILYLQQKKCFSNHPYSRVQPRGLSGHTINTYLRSIRVFWSWLAEEEIIAFNLFSKLKIPKAPKKIVATFSPSQIESLLAVMSSSVESYRNTVIVLTLLDTGLRINELTNLTIDNVWLEEGVVKVQGKGNKERLVPIGKQIRRLLWRYITQYRPEAALPSANNLFLNREGRPLTKNRVGSIMSHYGRMAGLSGLRCSPHTLRHTFAISFLRNEGDVFSLQRILGHSSLEMTRRYCQIADVDMKRAHAIASPVDNLAAKNKLAMIHSAREKVRDQRVRERQP